MAEMIPAQQGMWGLSSCTQTLPELWRHRDTSGWSYFEEGNILSFYPEGWKFSCRMGAVQLTPNLIESSMLVSQLF